MINYTDIGRPGFVVSAQPEQVRDDIAVLLPAHLAQLSVGVYRYSEMPITDAAKAAIPGITEMKGVGCYQGPELPTGVRKLFDLPERVGMESSYSVYLFAESTEEPGKTIVLMTEKANAWPEYLGMNHLEAMLLTAGHQIEKRF